MKRSKISLITVGCASLVILVYGAVYCAPGVWCGGIYRPNLVVHRDAGRARRAGAYFHYRIVQSDWLAYVFMPAAFIESRLIWINPKPFLLNPTWADVPQMLILQSPSHKFRFRASKQKVPK
jgi:hypothetical protein